MRFCRLTSSATFDSSKARRIRWTANRVPPARRLSSRRHSRHLSTLGRIYQTADRYHARTVLGAPQSRSSCRPAWLPRPEHRRRGPAGVVRTGVYRAFQSGDDCRHTTGGDVRLSGGPIRRRRGVDIIFAAGTGGSRPLERASSRLWSRTRPCGSYRIRMETATSSYLTVPPDTPSWNPSQSG